MAKHDQRILKFLSQNADRAPTITDMMTRLNISISEISASLSSLQAQGLITKKTNNQGIECWYPAGNAAVAGTESRVGADPRFIGGLAEKPMAPEPVPAQAVPSMYAAARHSEPPAYSAPAQHLSSPEMPSQPVSPITPPSGHMPMNAPSKGGIGFFTFLVGLALAVVVSAFMCNRLVERSVTHLSQNFVDQKVLNDAIGGMNFSSRQALSQVKTLEDQVKRLSDELAAMKTADSLKAAGPKAEEKKTPPPAAAVEAPAPVTPAKRHRRRIKEG